MEYFFGHAIKNIYKKTCHLQDKHRNFQDKYAYYPTHTKLFPFQTYFIYKIDVLMTSNLNEN